MNKERLLEIISNFRKVNVAVIGDLMIDDYIIGSVERISPEAPVPVVSVKEERFVLGGAGNVIMELRVIEKTDEYLLVMILMETDLKNL